MEIFYVLTKYVQSRLLQNCRMRERVKLQSASQDKPFYPNKTMRRGMIIGRSV